MSEKELCDKTAKHLYGVAFGELSRSQIIGVSDHFFRLGFTMLSRSLKRNIGVAHG